MKPTLPMYFLQSLRGHLSVVQSICSLKTSNEFAFLISLRTISHILGAREDMLSVPKYIVQFLRFCRAESFLRLYGICTKWKIFHNFQPVILGPNHFSLYKFLSLRFVDFFGEYLLIFLFSANHPRRDLFHACRQVLKLSRTYYYSVV